jgi:hypothetical protein
MTERDSKFLSQMLLLYCVASFTSWSLRGMFLMLFQRA